MRLVFVDTSAWIALGSKSDPYHPAARGFFKELASERAKLVTSDYVLAETYTGLSNKVAAIVLESFRLWVSSSMEKGRRAFTFDNHFPIMGVDAQPYAPPGKRARPGA